MFLLQPLLRRLPGQSSPLFKTLIILGVITIIIGLSTLRNNIPTRDAVQWLTSNHVQEAKEQDQGSSDAVQGPKYAYATFLSTRVAEDEDDRYFTATRVLSYQILHQPKTRSQKGYPLLVVVPPHVSMEKRQILADEGATVVPVELLVPGNWTLQPGLDRWIDQFTKLRLFEFTNYARIVYMDNDMLLTRCLDDIFLEDAIQVPRPTKVDPSKIMPDESTLPEDYVMAGTADNEGPGDHAASKASRNGRLNGGFLALRPCKELFQYYVSILETGDRFDKSFMEMGLLNYAHRKEGNMPWALLPPGKWSSNWPSFDDFKSGSATLHDKFWDPGNKNWIDRELVEMWWRVQGQMEGFWQRNQTAS